MTTVYYLLPYPTAFFFVGHWVCVSICVKCLMDVIGCAIIYRTGGGVSCIELRFIECCGMNVKIFKHICVTMPLSMNPSASCGYRWKLMLSWCGTLHFLKVARIPEASYRRSNDFVHFRISKRNEKYFITPCQRRSTRNYRSLIKYHCLCRCNGLILSDINICDGTRLWKIYVSCSLPRQRKRKRRKRERRRRKAWYRWIPCMFHIATDSSIPLPNEQSNELVFRPFRLELQP